MSVKADVEEYRLWAAVDTDTFEVVYVYVSSGQPALEAYLFLHEVLQRCRGRPVVKVDRGLL